MYEGSQTAALNAALFIHNIQEFVVLVRDENLTGKNFAAAWKSFICAVQAYYFR